MFLSERREFPSAPCLAGKETWWQLASRFCWSRTRPWHASEVVFFLVRLRTNHQPAYVSRSGRILCCKWIYDHPHTAVLWCIVKRFICYVYSLMMLLVLVSLVWWCVVVEFVVGDNVWRSWVILVRGSDSDVRDCFLFLKKLPSGLNPCLLNWNCGLL